MIELNNPVSGSSAKQPADDNAFCTTNVLTPLGGPTYTNQQNSAAYWSL